MLIPYLLFIFFLSSFSAFAIPIVLNPVILGGIAGGIVGASTILLTSKEEKKIYTCKWCTLIINNEIELMKHYQMCMP